MQYIEIEYSQELKPLEAVLSEVKQPGDFFVCGAMEMPMPRVEVDGAGTLSFPVPDAQIAALVRRAQRAPYGRGEETIVDTSIRNVWVNAVHCNVSRAETGWFKDRSFMLGDLCLEAGLEPDPEITSLLYSRHSSSLCVF